MCAWLQLGDVGGTVIRAFPRPKRGIGQDNTPLGGDQQPWSRRAPETAGGPSRAQRTPPPDKSLLCSGSGNAPPLAVTRGSDSRSAPASAGWRRPRARSGVPAAGGGWRAGWCAGTPSAGPRLAQAGTGGRVSESGRCPWKRVDGRGAKSRLAKHDLPIRGR